MKAILVIIWNNQEVYNVETGNNILGTDIKCYPQVYKFSLDITRFSSYVHEIFRKYRLKKLFILVIILLRIVFKEGKQCGTGRT